MARAVWSPDEIVDLRRLIATGASGRGIATTIGRSYDAVTLMASRIGLVIRPPLAQAPVSDDWRDDAACRDADTDVFFPNVNEDGVVAVWARDPYREARGYCDACPVRESCLEDELARGRGNQHGFRGGLDPVKRRSVLHRRGKARNASRSEQLADTG